jgi:hypothetical protein
VGQGNYHETGTHTGFVATVVEGGAVAAGPEQIGPVTPMEEVRHGAEAE